MTTKAAAASASFAHIDKRQVVCTSMAPSVLRLDTFAQLFGRTAVRLRGFSDSDATRAHECNLIYSNYARIFGFLNTRNYSSSEFNYLSFVLLIRTIALGTFGFTLI